MALMPPFRLLRAFGNLPVARLPFPILVIVTVEVAADPPARARTGDTLDT
jgi:hypothetical protein